MAIDSNGMSSLDSSQVIRSQAKIAADGGLVQKTINVASLVSETYDYISLTYVASGNGIGEIETASYKQGGAGGTTVATLTLTYDGSNKIVTVTRS